MRVFARVMPENKPSIYLLESLEGLNQWYLLLKLLVFV